MQAECVVTMVLTTADKLYVYCIVHEGSFAVGDVVTVYRARDCGPRYDITVTNNLVLEDVHNYSERDTEKTRFVVKDFRDIKVDDIIHT